MNEWKKENKTTATQLDQLVYKKLIYSTLNCLRSDHFKHTIPPNSKLCTAHIHLKARRLACINPFDNALQKERKKILLLSRNSVHSIFWDASSSRGDLKNVVWWHSAPHKTARGVGSEVRQFESLGHMLTKLLRLCGRVLIGVKFGFHMRRPLGWIFFYYYYWIIWYGMKQTIFLLVWVKYSLSVYQGINWIALKFWVRCCKFWADTNHLTQFSSPFFPIQQQRPLTNPHKLYFILDKLTWPQFHPIFSLEQHVLQFCIKKKLFSVEPQGNWTKKNRLCDPVHGLPNNSVNQPMEIALSFNESGWGWFALVRLHN